LSDYHWIYDSRNECRYMEITNNSRLTLFIDKSKEFPVIVWRDWFDISDNECHCYIVGRYKSFSAANIAVKHLIKEHEERQKRCVMSFEKLCDSYFWEG
jgi:hypothetical protein